MTDFDSGAFPINAPYRSRFDHGDCRPSRDRCDPVDHSRWRIDRLGRWLQRAAEVRSPVVRAAEVAVRGGIPRQRQVRSGDPGE